MLVWSSPGECRDLPYPVATQPSCGIHGAFAGRLHLDQLQSARRGPVEQLRVALLQRARLDVVDAGGERRPAYPKSLAVPGLHVGADVRRERAHAALQLVGGPARVEEAVGGRDLLGVGDALVGLLAEGGLRVERLDQQLAAQSGQPPCKAAVVVVGPDRLGALEADR